MQFLLFLLCVAILVMLGMTLAAALRIEKEQQLNFTQLAGRLRNLEHQVLKILGHFSKTVSDEKGTVGKGNKEKAMGQEPEPGKEPVSKPETLVQKLAGAQATPAVQSSYKHEAMRKPGPDTLAAFQCGVTHAESKPEPEPETKPESKPESELPKPEPILVAQVVDAEVVHAKDEHAKPQTPPPTRPVAEPIRPIKPIERPRPSYDVAPQVPYTPSPLEARTKEILGKIWNWIIVGEDYRPKDVSMEFAIATNWLMRVGALILIFGIGFFAKYSIDNNWVGPLGRIATMTVSGLAMSGVGTFLLGGKKYRLFGQGLVGVGIVTLYITVFAAMKLFEPPMIDQTTAFVLMALVTALACGIAIRFNTLLIALMGALGGYATPILLSTGTMNLPGLLGYLSILTAGVLALSYAKDWHLVRVVSLFGAWGLSIAALFEMWPLSPDDFNVAMPFMVAFFVMFSTMNLLYNVVKRTEATLLEFGMLWINAVTFFLVSYSLIEARFDAVHSLICCKEFAFVTLGMALFYVGHIYYFLVKKIKDHVLLSSFFAIASFMVTITVPILISKEWLAVSWSVQALVMLWIAQKLDSRFLQGVAGVIYMIVLCMFFGDLRSHFFVTNHEIDPLVSFWPNLFERILTFGTVIGSFFGGSWLLNRQEKRDDASPARETSSVGLAVLMSIASAGLGFLYLNVEFYKTFNYLDTMLTAPAMTVLWVGLAAFFLWQHCRYRNDATLGGMFLTIFSIVVAAVFLKFVFHDMMGWGLNKHFYYAACDVKGTMIRLFDFGILISLLTVAARLLWGSEKEGSHNLSVLSIVGSVALLFVYTTLELNSTLFYLEPDARLGGVSVLWSLYALSFIIIGIWKDVRAVRYVGLALFAVVTFKVFFVDLANVEKAYRVVAFIVLGAILMSGSLVYMKCRQFFDTRR